MEITRTNFEQDFDLVCESISNADFVAIDTEFSGYTSRIEDRPNEYETVEERYHKMKDSVQKFTPFQYGICTFKWDDTNKKYLTRPFVFYIFP